MADTAINQTNTDIIKINEYLSDDNLSLQDNTVYNDELSDEALSDYGRINDDTIKEDKPLMEVDNSAIVDLQDNKPLTEADNSADIGLDIEEQDLGLEDQQTQELAGGSTSKEIILCGDFNIAHRQIDLKNWRGNQKNSGFLPEERAWMDELLGSLGFVDAFRHLNKEADHYTWWSNRGQAWAKNVGWRIDYQIVTSGLQKSIQAVSIFKDQRFSDHAPVLVDYV